MRRTSSLFWSALGLLAGLAGAAAQQPDTAALVASQTEALKTFAMLDGVWRGPATVVQPNGEQRSRSRRPSASAPSSAARSR